jgi:hypothetical protein
MRFASNGRESAHRLRRSSPCHRYNGGQSGSHTGGGGGGGGDGGGEGGGGDCAWTGMTTTSTIGLTH